MENRSEHKRKRDKASDHRVTPSSGNIFADFDLPHSQEDMMKVEIAIAIAEAIKERKLTQVKTAEILGVEQSKVSDVERGRLRGYSVVRLLGYLAALGRDVEIRGAAATSKNARGRLRFVASAGRPALPRAGAVLISRIRVIESKPASTACHSPARAARRHGTVSARTSRRDHCREARAAPP
jgi:predicted XRE-type DNA-binding protein